MGASINLITGGAELSADYNYSIRISTWRGTDRSSALDVVNIVVASHSLDTSFASPTDPAGYRQG